MSHILQAAGIRSLEEAEMLIEVGFNHIGFPLRLDYHTPDLSESQAKEIIQKIKSSAVTVLITYQAKASEIELLLEYLGADAVQVHGNISLTELKALRALVPDKIILKSLVVRDNNLEDLKGQIDNFGDCADYFITDTYDSRTGASGATGKTHDWAVSLDLKEYSTKPLILAGGLTPDNVAEAINTVRPYGVDVHTGIEDVSGNKDLVKATDFVSRARMAFGI